MRTAHLVIILLGLAGSLSAAAVEGYRWNLMGEDGAKAEPVPGGVALRFANPGGQLQLMPAGDGATWDFSQSTDLLVDLENRSDDRQLRLNVRLRADREYVCGVALNPHERRTLDLRLPDRGRLRMPAGVPGPRGIDTAHVASIDFFLQWPYERQSPGLVDCLITNLRTEGTPAAGGPPADQPDFLPFIDRFGQYAHASWPEKITDPAQLPAARAAEAAELDKAKPPKSWDEFGGWLDGPQLEATGSFRTAKHDGRWWLVDPKGRLFFSQGLDVLKVRSDAIRTAGHESWYPPGIATPVWQPIDDNLRRKYGSDDFDTAYYGTMAKRLVSWGFNTIGDWGDHRLMELGGITYTLQLTDYNPKFPHLGGQKFYDVFDPAYAAHMRGIFDELKDRPIFARSLTDPFCLGYFIDNELSFRAPVRLVAEILKGAPGMAAKAAFADWLRSRHDAIGHLNQAWGTAFPDWDAIASGRTDPVRDGFNDHDGFKTDAHDFALVIFDRYFSLCREAVKSVAPDRLYLGCRFIGTDGGNPELAAICARYADVLSVNVYSHTPANFPRDDFPDIPVLIGEFHFGIGDRGMFSPGLCIAGTTPADRALAYTRFIQGALVHPNIVGAHWFQYRDQPLVGRWDGEGYQIGFVDVADTPYPEMTAASRALGEAMYGYRTTGRLVGLPAP